MKKRVLALLSVLVITSLFATPVAADGTGWGVSNPGEPLLFEQDIPINLVFVGYGGDMVDHDPLLDELPETYTPVVRYPQFYGLPGRDLGLKFKFQYQFIDANKRFENAFFAYLTSIGTPGGLTAYQSAYNAQDNNVLDVTAPVLYIDAPSAEKWLTDRARSMLHIDTRHSYTIFFINWHDRPDFKFHVYTKTDEPDPDTGYNFGAQRASRKMIAWGGTHGRTWFYDLSAGPEAWTNNWYVDDPDLDGNGVEDYRMPPIWEYAAGGYRDPSKLSGDLGKVARFVGINLLFTTSPLYDPFASMPDVGGEKILHINMFEDDPASQGTDWIDLDFAYDKLSAFQPYYGWQVHLADHDPIEAAVQRAFRIFAGLLAENDCWNAFGTPFAELFCFFDANRSAYIPAYGPADYVGGVFAFNTTLANLGDWAGLLGFADDNWVDGTPSYVFEFDTDYYRSIGYGFSTTTVHEFGHHIGMSHPHDGYDAEMDVDYGPSDAFYFAWSGDESHTIMHYMDLATDFGQFDRDNMYRYEFAGYLNMANALLDDVLAHPDVYKVAPMLWNAEYKWLLAIQAFDTWNYNRAVRNAYRAYVLIATAAQKLGIPTEVTALTMQAIPNASVPHEGDPIRFPDN